MSVLASDRPVSKFEAVYHAHIMRDMFNQLVLRNFGIRDVGPIARRKYILGKDNIENRDKYECLLDEYRGAIVRFSASVVQDVSAANAIYPKKLERIQPEIQSVVDTFDVDVNDYAQYSNAINREIDLIKRWRKSDNRFCKRFLGSP